MTTAPVTAATASVRWRRTSVRCPARWATTAAAAHAASRTSPGMMDPQVWYVPTTVWRASRVGSAITSSARVPCHRPIGSSPPVPRRNWSRRIVRLPGVRRSSSTSGGSHSTAPSAPARPAHPSVRRWPARASGRSRRRHARTPSATATTPTNAAVSGTYSAWFWAQYEPAKAATGSPSRSPSTTDHTATTSAIHQTSDRNGFQGSTSVSVPTPRARASRATTRPSTSGRPPRRAPSHSTRPAASRWVVAEATCSAQLPAPNSR
jgi:hypothetical protein